MSLPPVTVTSPLAPSVAAPAVIPMSDPCVAEEAPPVIVTPPVAKRTISALPVVDFRVRSFTDSTFAAAAASMFTSAPAVKYAWWDAELRRSSLEDPLAPITTRLSSVCTLTADHSDSQTAVPDTSTATQVASVPSKPSAQIPTCVATQDSGLSV